MKRLIVGGWSASLALLAASASAQERPWRPGAAAPPPAVQPARPVTVTLGRPQAIEEATPARLTVSGSPLLPAAYQETPRQPIYRGQSSDGWVPAIPTLGAPIAAVPAPAPAGSIQSVVAAAAPAPPPGSPYAPPPPPPSGPYAPPPPGGPYAPPPGGGYGAPPVAPFPGDPAAPPKLSGGLFGCDWLGCTASGGRKAFESDHCFDNMISPVTNPFLFEDPRALTELRPIFMYQKAPNSNAVYDGGNLWYLGTQARLAVTERLSFTLHKLGEVWSDPNNPAGGTFAPHSGFAELWLGPKLTFYRDDLCGSIAAFGVNFQIPAGSSDVFQSTGSLSVTPYITYGKHFLKNFNFLATAGYAIGDNERTDYFFNSYHLDWDFGGLHRIFPLVELNWFHYTKSGATQPINFEGRDLINFGATNISNTDSLTIAVGSRFKFSDCIQAGMALEFPLIASRDLLDFRVTTDLIFRY